MCCMHVSSYVWPLLCCPFPVPMRSVEPTEQCPHVTSIKSVQKSDSPAYAEAKLPGTKHGPNSGNINRSRGRGRRNQCCKHHQSHVSAPLYTSTRTICARMMLSYRCRGAWAAWAAWMHGMNIHTFKTRLALAETSCPSSPNLRSTASATQPFPAMARQEPPLSSRGLEDAKANPPLSAIIAANTTRLSITRWPW